MAIESRGGDGLAQLDDGQDRGWRRFIHTRLSLLALDEEGSKRCAALRDNACANAILASLRDANGGSAARGEWEDSQQAVLHDGGGLRIGEQRDGSVSSRSEEPSVQAYKSTQLAELPYVPDGYREPIEKTNTVIASDGLRNRDDLLEANAEFFDRLFSKAMRRADEILELPLPDRNDDNYIRMLSTIKDATVSVMNLGLKSDENRLRKRDNDVLQKLYDKIALEQGWKTIENVT